MQRSHWRVPLNHCIAYTRLGNVRTALSRTRSRVRLDVETGGVDETEERSSSANNHTTPMAHQEPIKSTKASNQPTDDHLVPMLSSQEDIKQARWVAFVVYCPLCSLISKTVYMRLHVCLETLPLAKCYKFSSASRNNSE